tara:strand:+ start:2095 stop:2991 length:897 start_codon:yes stop_codon:yes gene_type:complete
MTIFKEVIELLHDNDCVILPGFGAFILKNKSAYIKGNEFFPPSKFVSFNKMLNESDGLLFKYISKKRRISFNNSAKLVSNEVSLLKKKLSTDLIFEIKDLGIFEFKDKTLIFNPNYSVNFNNNSFGFKPFIRKPLDESIKKISVKENNFNINQFFRYAAVTLSLIAMSFFAYYNYNNYISNERIKNLAITQNQILKNVQAATFNLGELPSINIKVNSPEVINKKKYFSVIAGSFRSKNNAQKHLNELIKMGFEASYTSLNPKGLYRVAYARLNTRKDAYALISKIKQQGQDAWLLIEN